MPDLTAQGPQPQDRWRRRLPADRKIVLGRKVEVWATPWDDQISGKHVEMCWHRGKLEVTRLPSSRNPVFYRGQNVRHIALKPGEHFVIGRTTFTLSDEPVVVSFDEPQPVTEQRFSATHLRELRFRDADKRIDALSRMPEIILGVASDTELFVRAVNAVLTGVPRASSVAIVQVPPDAARESSVEVLHWDRRFATGDGLRPSERLIREAIDRGESILHLWAAQAEPESKFTHREGVDWAFCTPLQGTACHGSAIYVDGQLSGEGSGTGDSTGLHGLRDDLKFTELVATTLSNLREVRVLQRRQASLRQFFSPLVLEALAGEDPDVVLAPREAMVTVLFCDLRGFSRRSEQSRDDLLGLLRRVSSALGLMTRQILNHGGVVGDFHGDSAMGFWGWPLAQTDAAERACQAALAIRADFETAARGDEQTLKDFRIGIGIASGKAMAGSIGTDDLAKVTVFGPVVNLASRLEGMTKTIHAPILLDEATSQTVRGEVLPLDRKNAARSQLSPGQRLDKTEAPTDPSYRNTYVPERARLRKVAVVRPYGMQSAMLVTELLPPVSDYPDLSDQNILSYEAALEALLDRDWRLAFDLLHQVPANDLVKDFLTVFIAQHNRTAPPDWDGVIPLASK